MNKDNDNDNDNDNDIDIVNKQYMICLKVDLPNLDITKEFARYINDRFSWGYNLEILNVKEISESIDDTETDTKTPDNTVLDELKLSFFEQWMKYTPKSVFMRYYDTIMKEYKERT